MYRDFVPGSSNSLERNEGLLKHNITSDRGATENLRSPLYAAIPKGPLHDRELAFGFMIAHRELDGVLARADEELLDPRLFAFVS